MNDDTLLRISGLELRFHGDEGVAHALNGVDLTIAPGEAVGIAGESGCGKTVTSYAILQLLAGSAQIKAGKALFRCQDGSEVDLLALDPDGEEIRQLRWNEIAMIFQEPMTAFSPVHTIYDQISEALKLHAEQTPDKDEIRKTVIELLDSVGIPSPEIRVDDYSFQYSGGMRQRAMIAMSLACAPRLLIADEPTTALDVTVQAQVLKLIKKIQRERGLAFILITHDLSVLAHMVEKINIMYLGRVVERGATRDIFKRPAHPYTRDLLRSIPSKRGRHERLFSIEGSVPTVYKLPQGCPYHNRCTASGKSDRCTKQHPSLMELGDGHAAACFLLDKTGE